MNRSAPWLGTEQLMTLIWSFLSILLMDDSSRDLGTRSPSGSMNQSLTCLWGNSGRVVCIMESPGQITSLSHGGLHFHSHLDLQGISVPSYQDNLLERYV